MIATRFLGRLVAPLALPVVLILCWEQAVAVGVVDGTYFPAPSAIAASLQEMFDAGTLQAATGVTVTRTVIGWLLAAAVGILVGVFLGRSPTWRTAALPLVEFFRAIPAAAIAPAAILVFGVGAGTEVLIVAYAATWPVLLHTVAGVRSTDPLLLDAARSMRLSRTKQALYIQLPSAVPHVVVGLRVALVISLIVAVIAEMIASEAGLGNLIIVSRSRFRVDDVYAVVVALGVIGLVANGGIQMAENWITRWKRPPSGRRARQRLGATPTGVATQP